MDELLTSDEVCERLKLSKRTLRDMVDQGKIPVLMVGTGSGRPRFDWQEVVDAIRRANGRDRDSE